MKHLVTSSSLVLFFTFITMLSTAKDGDTIKRGQCSTRIETKLKVSPENGQIEVEYELEDAVPGSRWRVTVTKNGRTILRTTKRANGAGYLEVRQVTRNLKGNETIRATAKRVGAAGACTLSLSVPF